MRVMVTLENRFFRTQNGNVYSNTVCDYSLWSKYLQVFDEVVVCARVADIAQEKLDRLPANGPQVSFAPLPSFVGPWQYLKTFRKLNKTAKLAIEKADAFILRVPGIISTVVWRHLKKRHILYGVEVVGDPWESLSGACVKSIVSPIARYQLTKNLRKQCCDAVAAAYVSQRYLQLRYPPGCWSTNYSGVDLPDEAIINREKLQERFELLNEAVGGQRPFRICHAGTMAALYKAQDVIIKAISLCRVRGLDVDLTLLGDGKYRKYFERKARTLGIAQNVRFLGHIPPGKPVREQLDKADLFVLPSLTEGLPRALIEAMARGLPCIGTNVGGLPELLHPRDLVPPKDAGALAAKIEVVLSDENSLREMAQQSLEKAKEYNADKLNRRRIEFYKKVAERTPGYKA
ncbi:MAG: glycosyltransferase [Planctomycetota bacterium]